MKWSWIAAIAAALGAVALAVPLAGAHANFVSANPAPDSVLAAVPARLTIEFSQELARGTDITVTGPTGAVVSGVTSRSAVQASVDLQPAGSGRYAVQWTSVSAEDGDEASGAFQFTVTAPTSPAPAAASPASAAPRPNAAGVAQVTAVPRSGTGLTAAHLPSWWMLALVALMVAGLPLAQRISRVARGRIMKEREGYE